MKIIWAHVTFRHYSTSLPKRFLTSLSQPHSSLVLMVFPLCLSWCMKQWHQLFQKLNFCLLCWKLQWDWIKIFSQLKFIFSWQLQSGGPSSLTKKDLLIWQTVSLLQSVTVDELFLQTLHQILQWPIHLQSDTNHKQQTQKSQESPGNNLWESRPRHSELHQLRICGTRWGEQFKMITVSVVH